MAFVSMCFGFAPSWRQFLSNSSYMDLLSRDFPAFFLFSASSLSISISGSAASIRWNFVDSNLMQDH